MRQKIAMRAIWCFIRLGFLKLNRLDPALLIPDVLQEPVGRDFAAEAVGLRQLVDASRHCVELVSLQIAAL